MTIPGTPEDADTVSPEKRIADMVFAAIKAKLAAQFTSNLDEVRKGMEVLKLGLGKLWEGMDVAYDRLAQLERAQEPQGSRRGPKINPLEVYDGKLKALADQFI